MIFLTSVPFKYLLPVILLGLQIALKFFIDRRASAYNFVIAALEVPVSTLFLTLSLLAGFIITSKGDVHQAFVMVPVLIIILVFSIFIWRRSVEHFEKNNFGYTLMLGILNFVLSLPTLVYVINFLING